MSIWIFFACKGGNERVNAWFEDPLSFKNLKVFPTEQPWFIDLLQYSDKGLMRSITEVKYAPDTFNLHVLLNLPKFIFKMIVYFNVITKRRIVINPL